MKITILFFLLLGYALFSPATATPDLLAKTDLKKLLSLPLEELLQVEIDTAGKVSEKIGEIPASVVLITRKDIQRYGYTTLEIGRASCRERV